MPLADAGGINTWTEFDGSTRNNFIEGLTTSLMLAGWSLTQKVFSSVTGTYGSNPSNGQTVSAGYVTYTFVSALSSAANQVLIGANLAATLSNLVAAVNLAPGAGSVYSAATPINPIVQASATSTTVTFSFRFAGPMGNSTPTSFGILTNGGFKLTGQSPQSEAGSSTQMSAKVHVYDRGATAAPFGTELLANAQFLNAAETLASNEHSVTVKPGRTFRCVANQAQFFCYSPSTAADPAGSVLCGGVMWIAPASACSGDVPQIPATFSFWTANDFDSLIANAKTTPRTVTVGIAGSHNSSTDLEAQVTQTLGDANGYLSSDGAFNGAITLGDFQMVSLHPAYNYGVDTGTLRDAMRWHGGNGVVGRRMLLEPLVAWSPPTGGAPLVRGQLWNSWIGTDQAAMDTVEQFSDGNFYVAFTNQCAFGTLWLQVPGLKPLSLNPVSYAH